MTETLRRLITWHARGHRLLSRPLFLAAQTYANHYCAVDDYDIRTNGEFEVLRALRQFAPKVLLDVGANRGDWTAAALETLPNAVVHAFELSPVTAQALETRFRSESNVVVNHCGLSAANGDVEVRHCDTDPTLTTIGVDPLPGSTRVVRGRVVTGHSYALSNGIDSVDLAKIDTEGHDLDVIRGLGPTIDRCTIVQFEYNELSWSRGIFIQQYVDALPNHMIGRLTGARVVWERGLISNLRGIPGNMVAVRADRPDIIKAFARF